MRSIFGEGSGDKIGALPLPEICFAPLANYRPSLKGRLERALHHLNVIP